MPIIKKNNKCFLCDNKAIGRVYSKIPNVLEGISLRSCDEHREAVVKIFQEMQSKELERQRKVQDELMKKWEDKNKFSKPNDNIESDDDN